MISYEGLSQVLSAKNMTKTDLVTVLHISSRTIAKIAKGEKISQRTMQKIADFLSCDVSSLVKTVSLNPILQTLRDEKKARISGGLYHELQVRMTYNSNHIEGSKLSEDQTRMIFRNEHS